MDFQQQPHPYNRPPPPPQQQQQPLPPPPSMADPHYPPPPPHSQRPPVPPPGSSWYSNQFQYHPQSPPPPPPPQPQQWGPPLPPPPPFPGPYQAHHIQQQAQVQYQPTSLPPRPPAPQSFPHGNQDYWGQHQSWGNSAHSNEDWAAKAREWAAAKAASDHQHQHSQFTHDSRPEEQSHYYEQYAQPTDHHFQDMQQPPVLSSSNQHSMTPQGPPHPQRASFGHPQEPAFYSSGQSPYVLPYTAREGNFAGDSVASFPQHGNSSISPIVHQQEVPSSYSSTAGKDDAGNQNEAFYGSSPLTVNSTHQHDGQLMPPATHKPAVTEENHYVIGPDLSDQPLDFAPHFSREHDRHSQSYYVRADSGGSVGGTDPVSAIPSNYTWPSSAAPGAAYPPLPPVPPQVDPTVIGASPVPEHTLPLFGRVQSSSFHPTVPSVGAHFGVGAGASLHPPSAFPADAYGISDRPKKAAVPNWLREEIIKKKAVITTSTPNFPKEDSQSIEDEGADKSYRKGDQADSKSIDSSRSTEEEDDDEVEVEAARTAAMNQEIKRILTEVLLKVTDELFDEIATRALSEEDLTVDVEQQAGASTQKVSGSVQAVTTPKATAKVLVPLKHKDAQSVDASEKSTSSSPADLLGLGSYASDDEDDNEIQSSDKLKPKEHDNGKSHEESEEHDRSGVNLVKNPHKRSPNVGNVINVAVSSKSTDDRTTGYPVHEGSIKTEPRDTGGSIKTEPRETGGSIKAETRDTGGSTKTEPRDQEDKMLYEKDSVKTQKASETLDLKKTKTENSRSEDRRDKSDKSVRREVRKGSGTKDNGMDTTSSKERKTEKERNHEERHVKKEKVDDQDGSKDRVKEKGRKSGEKTKEPESRKRPSSPSNIKEERKEAERDSRAGVTTDNGRKKERTKDEKREKSRPKDERGSSRRRRHRSSSIDSWGRESKDNSARANVSSDESSDDSRRKGRPNRHRSPSPVRSRKRHVSRSPHSKHSQRRHSPYPASESIRGKRSRSRSRSPVRRKR